MIKTLPEKWIRKAIFDVINNISVVDEMSGDVLVVKCYDSRVMADNDITQYVLMTTQTNTVDKSTKCGNRWESSILLDIVTTFNGAGNYGSRLLADNILDKVRELTDSLTLDVASGLEVVYQSQDFPNDLVTVTSTENIYRKFMRIELLID
jgi:hypothetical protein